MYFFINKKRVFAHIKNRGIFGLFSYLLSIVKKTFYIFYLTFNIRKLDKNYTPESLINYIYTKNEGLIRPIQIKSEIIRLIKIIKKKKLKTVIEIGTAQGGTLFLISKVLPEDSLIISIDLPGGRFGYGYPKIKIRLFKSFLRSKQKMHLIRADSHKLNTLNKVKEILNNRTVDFLFIDGDHTYEGVKKDFEMYSPLVNNVGIIGFHDIVISKKGSNVGVNEFWIEIKKNYEYEEIVEDWNQLRCGIGILKRKKT